jgi:hypothetical protein
VAPWVLLGVARAGELELAILQELSALVGEQGSIAQADILC